MSVFHFKRFSVSNDRSAMKVNTDGVLLGAAMTLPENEGRESAPQDIPDSGDKSPAPLSTPKAPAPLNILDIGTGTGTIALITAQRLSDAGAAFVITGIDIDRDSASEAGSNFASSPWADNLHAIHVPLQDLDPAMRYDHIVSNPPYFDCSLQAPEQRRNDSRHCTSLSYRDILEYSGKALTAGGTLSLILPSETEKDLLRCARMNGLFAFRILRIRTVQRKVPRRIIVEFSRTRCPLPDDSVLTIQEKGNYTREYVSLVKDFYSSLQV